MSGAVARTRLTMGDQRHVDFVRTIVADVRRGVTDAIVEARAAERLEALLEGDERPSERIRRENAAALAAMAALGNSRDAAWRVAGRCTKDPHKRKMLAQRYRRVLLRTRK
jgi:hypothetical protein